MLISSFIICPELKVLKCLLIAKKYLSESEVLVLQVFQLFVALNKLKLHVILIYT